MKVKIELCDDGLLVELDEEKYAVIMDGDIADKLLAAFDIMKEFVKTVE